MKCPLFLATYTLQSLAMQNAGSICLQGECAWWEQDLSLCAIKEIALELRYTQLRLADIGDKIPRTKETQ